MAKSCKITIQQFGDSCDLQYSTPSPKAPLSHSVSHKVFLKTLGQTSVALQKYGPKGFAILYLSLSFSRYRRILRDSKVVALGHTNNRTMKRRNVEQCQKLGMVDFYSPVSTSKVRINSKSETHFPSMTIPLGFPCTIAAARKHISACDHVKQAVSQSSTCSLSFHG